MEIEVSLEAIQKELSKFTDIEKNSKIYEDKLLQIISYCKINLILIFLFNY